MIDTTGGWVDDISKRIGLLRQSGYGKQNGGHIGLRRVKVSLETALKRNQMRPRRVPEDVLKNQHQEHDPMHPHNLEYGTPYQRLSKLVDSARTVDYEDHQVKAEKSKKAWQAFSQQARQFSKSLVSILEASLLKWKRSQYV